MTYNTRGILFLRPLRWEEGGDDGRLAVYFYAYKNCHGCSQVKG